MAKKSPKKEETLKSGEQPVKAVKKSKAAKPAKTPKTSKAPKPASAPKAATVAHHAEKPAKSSAKKKEAPIAALGAAAAPVANNLVAVMEKPQPTQELVVIAAPVETVEPSAPRFESANAEDAAALYILGIRYSTGRDVEQDLIAAHKWFNLAAMMGHEDAKSCRADVASEMSKAQIAEAQRQARDWMRARDTKHSREAEQVQVPERIKRPTYVRRRAQAIRSANSFARTCACA